MSQTMEIYQIALTNKILSLTEQGYSIEKIVLSVTKDVRLIFSDISAATKPILLSASTWEIELEIFLIFILGFGLMTFLDILSQYILNLERPWP